MRCKERLTQYLKDNGASFEIVSHPRAYTAQGVAAAEHVPGNAVAKVVMVLADARPVMVVVPAPEHVDLERVRVLVGAEHVRLADESEFAPLFLDCEVGAMPPFGNLYDLPTYLDEALTSQPTLVMQAGNHVETCIVATEDYMRLVRPVIGHLTRHSHALVP